MSWAAHQFEADAIQAHLPKRWAGRISYLATWPAPGPAAGLEPELGRPGPDPRVLADAHVRVGAAGAALGFAVAIVVAVRRIVGSEHEPAATVSD